MFQDLLKRLADSGRYVELKLVGLDGNAFALMGAFKKAARAQGWPPEDVKIVLDECMTGDYDHLLGVLAEVTRDDQPEED